ncbi:MAG: heavy-metal-associated domain-containing protein [Actinomycetota bacterium]
MQETFNVPDVSCEHCKHAIEGALNPLEGVASATVDIEGKTVSVAYDENSIKHEAVVSAIEGEGYPVSA